MTENLNGAPLPISIEETQRNPGGLIHRVGQSEVERNQAGPPIVFDVELSMYSVPGNTGPGLICEDGSVYRAHRITAFHAPPPLPVGDPAVSWTTGNPVPGFTGDDCHRCLIESSFDLMNSTTLGAAVGTAPGSEFLRFQEVDGSCLGGVTGW